MRKIFSLFIAAVAGFALVSPLAQAQVTPRTVILLELSTATAAAGATTTITSQAFSIKPGSGFAIVPNFQLAGAGTENVTFNFAVSVDGTTWSTTRPFTYQVAATGTTPVIGFKNFGSDVTGDGANNILYVRLASVTNGSGSQACTINSIRVTKNN